MKKVIIIGAGPAGLTAAYQLLKQSKEVDVTILEESQMAGGISRTVQFHGNRMDIGGHRFFSKDESVMNFWKEILPMQGALSLDDKILKKDKTLFPGGPDPEKVDRVMLLRQRVSRIYYRKKFFDYPVKMNANTLKNMGIGQTVVAGCSYLASCVHKRKEDSLENFYINRFGKVLYSMFFEGYTEKLWGRHPREISADWGAQRVKGLSVLAILKDILGKAVPGAKNRKVETSLIEEFIYPKYGPGQLWETVAEEILKMGGKICYGCKVKEIHLEEQGDTGRVSSLGVVHHQNTEETETKEETQEKIDIMSADYFVSSMPLKDLTEGMGEAVPQEIRKIAAGLPYRDFVTVGLLLSKLNLKNLTKIRTLQNVIPDCWIYVQDTDVKLGRIQIFNNWSPYMVAKPEEKVWIGLEYFCSEGDSFWNMKEEDCINMAVAELLKMGVISDKADVEDAHREKVKKAYPAYFDTYSEIDKLTTYLNRFENLFCIGRNGQHRYNNMDHSMVTAFETVNNILTGRKDKDNIWNVNTEQEYHEEKAN